MVGIFAWPCWAGMVMAGVALGLPPAQDRDAILEKLGRRMDLPEGIPAVKPAGKVLQGLTGGILVGMPLEKVLEDLGNKYSLKFRFDTEAFQRLRRDDVKVQPVHMPNYSGITLRTILRLLLDQADAHYVVVQDAVVIRPNSKEKVPVPPPDPGIRRWVDGVRAKLAKRVTLDKGIDPMTRLDDALEFLGDRYDLTIVIHPKHKQLYARFVQLPPSFGASLDAVLLALLAQADAHYELWDDTLVILPGKK
jgi:hypothetical protein